VAALCLLGRHGCGKSTLGAALVGHGYRHVSVGLLRRLALYNHYPLDVPVTLISAMRREKAGALLSPLTAERLMAHISAGPLTVVDGFPADAAQLSLLPRDTVFCVVWTPATLRAERLENRAATSKRQWTPGRPSARELALPALITEVRRSHRWLFIRNSGSIEATVAKLLRQLQAG
jgi:hypothetical protein